MWIDRLKTMKLASGKTTKQISEESGIPIGTLNKLFAGQTADPKLNTIKTVVYCLDGKLSDLDDFPQEAEKAPPMTDEAKELLELYNELNPEGQRQVTDYADTLVKSGKYPRAARGKKVV